MMIQAVLILWLSCHSLALEYRMHDAYRPFKKIGNPDEPGFWPALAITIGILLLLFIATYCYYKRHNL